MRLTITGSCIVSHRFAKTHFAILKSVEVLIVVRWRDLADGGPGWLRV